MNRILRLALASLLFALAPLSLMVGPGATAAEPNLIANPSAETSSGGNPTGWTKNKWGLNNAAFSYANTGQAGTRSLSLTVTGYINGDAKWMFTPVSVTPGTAYTFSDWYKSTVGSEVNIQITNTSGAVSYAYLGSPAASPAWRQYNTTWTAPANAKTVSIFHMLKANGTLSTDNFSLAAATPTPTPTPTATPTPTPSPSPSPGPNSVPNPSLETAAGTQPQNWSSSSWGTNQATFNYLGTGRTGTRSVRTTISNYSNGAANWTYTPQAVTPGAHYRFTDWYMSGATTEIDAAITMSDGTTQYYFLGNVLPSATWAQASVEFDMPAGAVSATVYHLLAANGSLTTDDYSFGIYAPPPLARGLVSVQFDDGWTNQYTNAFPTLTQYGLPATFFIISGELNNQPYYMNVSQIRGLQTAGHEIASHTVSHLDLTTLSATQLTNQMKNSQATLQSNFGTSIKHLANPYGAYNAKTIAEGKKYYTSQRTTETGYNTKGNFNLTKLKVQNIYATTTPAQVQEWVNTAIQDRTWLILLYHEVGTTPIDPSNAEYLTTPSDFNAEMAIIKNSGIQAVTTTQAINEILPQLGQ